MKKNIYYFFLILGLSVPQVAYANTFPNFVGLASLGVIILIVFVLLLVFFIKSLIKDRKILKGLFLKPIIVTISLVLLINLLIYIYSHYIAR